jgi:hypothetical protein
MYIKVFNLVEWDIYPIMFLNFFIQSNDNINTHTLN